MKNIENYRYHINENNVVEMWNNNNPNENNEPFLYQPDKPDGTPWASYEEAENWCIEKINELPQHFKENSNNKCLIKYENYDDFLCFWRCFAYHYDEPKDSRDVNKRLKQ